MGFIITVILPRVFFVESYTAVANGDRIHGREPGVLNGVFLEEITYFGTYHPNGRIALQFPDQRFEETGFHFRIVIDQEEEFALCHPDP